MNKIPQNQKDSVIHSAAHQNIDSTSAMQSLAPPPLQFKTEPTNKSEEEKQEVQLKEKSHAGGMGENPEDNSDEGSSSKQPFQLKAASNNTGLPDNLKSGIEGLSGFSMDDVKVNYNSSKPAQLQAHAYAQGSNIEIGPGQEKHLPHEAWHVVQQKQGRVQPTTQLKAFNINDDVGLEQEADDMGSKAMQLKFRSPRSQNLKHSSGSSTNAVQRYQVKRPEDYLLEKDPSENARNPFTRNDDEMAITERGEGKAPGIAWPQSIDDKPTLKISEDSSLAINATEGEPKEFYANTQVLNNANQQLSDSGNGVKLLSAGNKIKIGTNHELIMIQPVKKEDDALPGQDEFISLGTDVCRDVASKILGGITHLKLGDQNPNLSKARTGNSTQIGGTHELADSLVNSDPSIDEANNILDEKSQPTPGKEYGKALRNGDLDEKTKELGINESARASVGEGYTTQSIFDSDSSKTDYAKGDDHNNEFVWGYHYSSVIAESLDKQDQMALENYNRSSDINAAVTQLLAELKSRFANQIQGLDLDCPEKEQIGKIMQLVENSQEDAKKLYANMFKELNSTTSQWYFRIIGSAEGQSFHEQMAESNYFVNPMTFAVVNRQINQMPIAFDEGSSDIKADQVAILDRMAQQILSAVARNRSPKEIKIIGHGTGYKRMGIGATKKGTKRANAIYDYLVQKGVDPGLLTVSSEGKIENDHESFSRNRNVTFDIID